ncbi:MAG: ABC transporter ATP-binding protein [Cyanobacteria bacterium P01_H01_bin.74]
MSNASIAVETQDLTKSYAQSEINVLQGVNLTIETGEFIALMGPSGCGKSTLLNILGAIDRPSSGKVMLFNDSLGEKDDRALTQLRRTRLGFVFQFFNLMATLTAYENVALPLELSSGALTDSVKAQRERIEALIEQVGMTHRKHAYPSALSGGEMQRIAIARALIHQPQIILADEPTGNLDSENGERILDLLKILTQQNGQTIIMATHSNEAAAVANRTVRMKDGQILAA